jgi:hypothetical protein
MRPGVCISPSSSSDSGTRDNHTRGSVGDFLKQKIQSGSKLSIVSALDPKKTDKKSFKMEDDGLALQNRLHQKLAAKACAAWIREKVSHRQADHVAITRIAR